ncbi:MAG: hypothetical protein AABZ83_07960, partial [candidate division NC10 bacterium]
GGGGFCDQVSVILQADGGVRVEDNGRGIPIDVHPKYNTPALEVALTVLHAGLPLEAKASPAAAPA